MRQGTLIVALVAIALWTQRTLAQWNGYAGNPQHSAVSSVASLSLNGIRWSTQVDEAPPAGTILIHYGSPVITAANTVIVPVRAADGSYCFDALRGSDGSQLWETMR